MKKVLSILLLIVVILIPMIASAQSPKIIDGADLLTQDQVLLLEQKAETIIDKYQMDVVILTVNSTDGIDIQRFADDYYDNNGYGVGPDYSGVLFMLAMDTRQWWISTCGDGIYALTDYGIQMLFSEIASYLSGGDYYAAFDLYLEELEDYYEAFTNDTPIDGYRPDYNGPGTYEPGDSDEIVNYKPPLKIGKVILTSLLIGAVVAGIVLLIMSSGMKTAKRQSGAYNYTTNGVAITRQHHFFLYSRTSRTAKPQNSGGSGNRRVAFRKSYS